MENARITSLPQTATTGNFRRDLFSSTALKTAGGQLWSAPALPKDLVSLSANALQSVQAASGKVGEAAVGLAESGWNALSTEHRKAFAVAKAKAGGIDPDRMPATLQRPLILVHGIRSGADTFTERGEGKGPAAVDYLTRNKNNVFGGTIVGVDAKGKLLVLPRATAENPKPKPTTEVPAGANLFTIDLNKGSNTIEQNGGELRDAIEAIAKVNDAAHPGKRSKVDIMGWSHGGLDGLRAAQMTGDRVAHLTTLGSPFQGTTIAPLHPILRALESFDIGKLFQADPIRDELSPGSKVLQNLVQRQNEAQGLKIMNVSGLNIGPGGGDGVVAPDSSQISGALKVRANRYAHTRMHNAPDVLDQVLNFNNGQQVQTDLQGNGTLLDLVV